MLFPSRAGFYMTHRKILIIKKSMVNKEVRLPGVNDPVRRKGLPFFGRSFFGAFVF